MVFSGAEEFYAVRLTRLVVVSKTMHIAPVMLRYVFVDDDKFDVEMKGDDYTEKKSLDMLCKSLRKEIEIQGNTWKQGGKPTQLLKCSVHCVHVQVRVRTRASARASVCSCFCACSSGV